MKKDYKEGFLLGIPIGVGYFCVSFAFGMMVKNVALPTWIAFLISATNLTSAGQFAGLNLIVQQATYVEIMMTTLIINLRYAIMSMSLSQKVEVQGVPTLIINGKPLRTIDASQIQSAINNLK